ncbi:MAG: GGDEF domain-containing protein [Treponema sp.]|nr:GGDEF domain-containing protein [Treponema sp.]
MENEVQYIHNLKYEDITRSLARDFFRIFCVNTNNDKFIEFIPHEQDQALDICMLGDDFKKIVKEFEDSTYSEDIDTVHTAFKKENILKVLCVDNSFSLNYRMLLDGKATYVGLKATRVKQNDSAHILIAFSNTDAHMQRIAMYERTMKKSLTYAGIAEALAYDYDCIYYVNTKTNEYIEYKSSDEYKKLHLAPAGRDFFDFCTGSFFNLIYVDDKDTFLQAVNKENFMNVLSVDRLFLLTFRIILNGEATYFRMKATRMALEDNHHIVIGLSNIDESIKRRAHYEMMTEIANRDSLTGVKSKHAYTEAEEHINFDIEHEADYVFAVAVCDVNGLKQINDTLGHKAGDKYIKEACSIICHVFQHSPVFRIGGDEFAVILKGNDYEKREELMKSINNVVEKNKNEGRVVVAVGLSEYIPGEDKSVSDVFERADAIMYKRKLELKSARIDSE